MLIVLIVVAIFIICTVCTIFWMSRAPQIEVDDEGDIDARASDLADNEANFTQTKDEPAQQKAKGA